MLIRALTSADRIRIAEMLQLCRAFNEEEIRVALELFDEGVAHSSPDGYVLFGAEQGGKLQGYICIGRVPLTASSWDIYWICTHPAAQRSGAGRALVAHAENYVIHHGGRRLVAQTSGRPDYAPAHKFYAAVGYAIVGRIPDYFQDGDDGVIFCKSLETEAGKA